MGRRRPCHGPARPSLPDQSAESHSPLLASRSGVSPGQLRRRVDAARRAGISHVGPHGALARHHPPPPRPVPCAAESLGRGAASGQPPSPSAIRNSSSSTKPIISSAALWEIRAASTTPASPTCRVLDNPAARATEIAAMAQWMIGESHFHQQHYAHAIAAYERCLANTRFPRWQAAAPLASRQVPPAPRPDRRGHAKTSAASSAQYADQSVSAEARQRLASLAATATSLAPFRGQIEITERFHHFIDSSAAQVAPCIARSFAVAAKPSRPRRS